MGPNYIEFSRVLSRAQKSFEKWQIPWEDMVRLELERGMPFEARFVCERLRGRFRGKTLSGCNFRLPQTYVDRVASIAKADPSMEILFRLEFDEVEIDAGVFSDLVIQRLQDSSEARRERLANAPTHPETRFVRTIIYDRNPDVVAERLYMANGVCEQCGCEAPFARESDNTPYLEVHHLKPLSEGGADTIENTIAVCPNCHRRHHYGPFFPLEK